MEVYQAWRNCLLHLSAGKQNYINGGLQNSLKVVWQTFSGLNWFFCKGFKRCREFWESGEARVCRQPLGQPQKVFPSYLRLARVSHVIEIQDNQAKPKYDEVINEQLIKMYKFVEECHRFQTALTAGCFAHKHTAVVKGGQRAAVADAHDNALGQAFAD